MLQSEGAGGGNALNVRKKETCKGEADQFPPGSNIQSAHIEMMSHERRQTRGQLADNPDNMLREAEQRPSHKRKDHHCQCDWLSRQQFVSSHQEGDSRETDCEHYEICAAELLEEEPDALEKIITATFYAKEFGQLSHADRQRRPGFEADEDAFGNEINDDAQAQQPREEKKGGNEQCAEDRQREKPISVAAGKLRQRNSEHEL